MTHQNPRVEKCWKLFRATLSDLFYSKTKQKRILKNALRFQRQHQATSYHYYL